MKSTKIITFILTYFNKKGEWVADTNLIERIRNLRSESHEFQIVINNLENTLEPVFIGQSTEYIPNQFTSTISYLSHLGFFPLMEKNLSVPDIRNFIIGKFLRDYPEFTHMTMIDGDDSVSKDYSDKLIKFSNYIDSYGIFNAKVIDKDYTGPMMRDSGVSFNHDMKYIKRAANWAYLYHRSVFESGLRFIKSEGHQMEDTLLYLVLSSKYRSIEIPFIRDILYVWDRTNSVVSNSHSDKLESAVDYLCNNATENYKLITLE